MNTDSSDAPLDRLFRGLFFVGVVTLTIVVGFYWYWLAPGSAGLSRNPKDWAEFGEYLGGTLGGIFAFYAFVCVLITLVRQKADSARQVQATLDAVTRAHSIQIRSQRQCIFAVAEAAQMRAERIRQVLNEDDRVGLYQVYDKSIIDGIVSALSALPVHEIGSRDGVLALLAMRDQFVFLGKSMEIFTAGPFSVPELKAAIDSFSASPEELAQRSSTIESARAVLRGNVVVHLDAIQTAYRTLESLVSGDISGL